MKESFYAIRYKLVPCVKNPLEPEGICKIHIPDCITEHKVSFESNTGEWKESITGTVTYSVLHFNGHDIIMKGGLNEIHNNLFGLYEDAVSKLRKETEQ